MKELLSGNEALARGALEAGIEIACGYPGTPSSEILENVAKYKEIYSEWSVNEKVARRGFGYAGFHGRARPRRADSDGGGNREDFTRF